jgi:hypothetical protein
LNEVSRYTRAAEQKMLAKTAIRRLTESSSRVAREAVGRPRFGANFPSPSKWGEISPNNQTNSTTKRDPGEPGGNRTLDPMIKSHVLYL